MKEIDINSKEFRSRMRETLEDAIEEAKTLAKASHGAACFYTYGFASCAEGITYKQAQEIASSRGLMFRWYEGKSCSQISCTS